MQLVRQYLVTHVGRKVDLGLIAGYARHILGLPLRFFEMRRVGEILSRVNDAAKVREAVSGTTLTAIVDGTLVMLLLAVLWLYDVQLALVATAFVPLLVLSVVAHHPLRGGDRARRWNMRASCRLTWLKMFPASRRLRHSAPSGGGRRKVKSRLVALGAIVLRPAKARQQHEHAGTFVTALAGLVVLWYGGDRVMDGALTIGQLMFFYTLLGFLLEPLERLASVNLKLQEALIAVDRLYQMLDLETEPHGAAQKAPFQGVR